MKRKTRAAISSRQIKTQEKPSKKNVSATIARRYHELCRLRRELGLAESSR